MSNPQLNLDELPTVLREVVRQGYSIGRSGQQIKLASLSTLNNMIVIRRLCLAMKPTSTLEVGFALGGSCLVFTQSHRDLGERPNGQHIAIDPHQRSHWIDEAGLVAVEKSGLLGYLDFREEYSYMSLPKLVIEGRNIDIAYIDGFHLF
jgi:hypothetical protein